MRHVEEAPTAGVRAEAKHDQQQSDRHERAGEQVGLFDGLGFQEPGSEAAILLDQAWAVGRAQGFASSLFAEDGDEGEDEVVLPTTIELIPAGKVVKARDGRRFKVDRDEVVRRANENDADLFIDWDHAAFAWFNAGGPRGEQAPAAAWVDHASVRKKGKSKHAAIVGDVKYWTPSGANSLRNRDYRYLSPAVSMTRTEGDDMPTAVELLNSALVNMPALRMPALASRQPAGDEPKEHSMDPKTIALALGLKPDASETDILAAASAGKQASEALVTASAEVKELKEQNTSLLERVEKATTRADEADELLKQERAEHQAKLFDQRIDVLASGDSPKLTPADADDLRDDAKWACEQGKDAVERFEKRLVKKEKFGKPALPATEDLDKREPPKTELTVAGLSKEQVLASIEAFNKRRKKGEPEMTLESYVKANPQYAAFLEGGN